MARSTSCVWKAAWRATHALHGRAACTACITRPAAAIHTAKGSRQAAEASQRNLPHVCKCAATGAAPTRKKIQKRSSLAGGVGQRHSMSQNTAHSPVTRPATKHWRSWDCSARQAGSSGGTGGSKGWEEVQARADLPQHAAAAGRRARWHCEGGPSLRAVRCSQHTRP